MTYDEIKSQLKPWHWCELMPDGKTINHIFDGRLQMPLYDMDLEEGGRSEEIIKYWEGISKKYPLTNKDIDAIVDNMFR